MNLVNGVISRIAKNDDFNRTEVKVRGKSDFIVLTLGLNEAFRENARVSLIFKESDVMLARGRHWMLSVENRLPCSVVKIKAGVVFAELELKTGFGHIRALIDIEAYRRLKLVCGEELNAFIKANEISMMTAEA